MIHLCASGGGCGEYNAEVDGRREGGKEGSKEGGKEGRREGGKAFQT